ncbi:unnamed protein product [Tuber melanosporum]|uniref:(Perigord truffle) hypothetical protein n=1 Tax=Tuber melanosporum (strain Mel28) TaxID=656061 RepID=D5GCZ7_TUBMM|nr:uncharacterized protein GSTUM_00006029001 [Tuber melanosporum]CAZ82390.1 unnamed protein product [Tuber melanosporum]
MAAPIQKNKITERVAVDPKTGEFQRKPSVFRDAISKAHGARFPPEKGRNQLYVSYACPWAHGTQIIREP